MRVLAETVVGVLLAVAVAILGIGVFQGVDRGADLGTAVTIMGPRLLLFVGGAGVALWIVAVIASNIVLRHRAGSAKLLTSLVAAVVTTMTNFIVLLAVGGSGGGAVLSAYAFGVGVAFVAAVLVSEVVTHVLLPFRRPSAPEPQPVAEHREPVGVH